jgi:hypothetical protein
VRNKSGDKSVIKWNVQSQKFYEIDTLQNAVRTFEILGYVLRNDLIYTSDYVSLLVLYLLYIIVTEY